MKTSQKPISLYIHWPYCLSKCPYCDFASTAPVHPNVSELMQGYQRDIDRWLTDRPISTIFFGGGTPSLMTPQFLDELLNQIHHRTTLLPECEITIEANPDAIDRQKMIDFKSLGVNRLSLGVQALTDLDLLFLGRRHTVQTALKRIAEAQDIFDRINIDLIYARPHQTPQQWEKELTQALSLKLSHYSLYQLTIEENTVFGRRGQQPASEATAAKLYRLTDSLMTAAGCPAYEVSNYARPGQECRHNMAYWLGQDYIGIGPAAHGRIGMTATQNPRRVSDWLQKGTEIETLTPRQKQIEKLLMGLRLRQAWFPDRDLPADKVLTLTQKGLLEHSPQGIRPTRDGILILDRLILDLMPD